MDNIIMKYWIILSVCVVIIGIIYYYTSNIKEGIGGPELPSGSFQAQINTTEDMRKFLEQMYMITLANANDQKEKDVNYTECYKLNILGTYLWPLLGPFSKLTITELLEQFGEKSDPKSAIREASEQQDTTPKPTPIITSDIDYHNFMRLAILGKMIVPFSTMDNNGDKSVVLWYKSGDNNVTDICYKKWKDREAALVLGKTYLLQIGDMLSYFHRQVDNTGKIKNGDSTYTTVYT
jgi:hypothetical protein